MNSSLSTTVTANIRTIHSDRDGIAQNRLSEQIKLPPLPPPARPESLLPIRQSDASYPVYHQRYGHGIGQPSSIVSTMSAASVTSTSSNIHTPITGQTPRL